MKPDRCPTCKRLRKRSNPANARYWILLHLIADNIKPEGVQHDPKVWHEYMKQRFIGVDEFVLPNKEILKRTKSSAELDTSDFAEYMRHVEEFAMSRNVYMDDVETLR